MYTVIILQKEKDPRTPSLTSRVLWNLPKNMFIITEYTLSHKKKNIFVESNGTVPPCPHCQGQLKYRDKKLRILKKEGGDKQWLMISRYRCENCSRYHNALPDCLVPFKHYETEVIAGVLDGVVTPDDSESEDYPSSMTMLRWIAWFQFNIRNIEGYLRNAYFLLHGFADPSDIEQQSLLDRLQKSSNTWLESLIRTIYNSGGFLPAFWL